MQIFFNPHYELIKFFPDDDNDALKLHKIIMNQFHKLFQGNDWIQKFSEYYDFPEKVSKLTPLHLCAILGNHEVAELLLLNSDSPKKLLEMQDLRGWTPLHHAASGKNDEILKLFVQTMEKNSEKAIEIRNDNGGTYKDLRELAFPRTVPLDSIVFSYKSAGKIIQGTARKFKEITGSQFADQIHASPRFFIQEWNRPRITCEAENRHKETLQEAYASYQLAHPLLYLEKTMEGYGVFAQEEIQSGRIVVDYIGKVTHQPSSHYATELYDGKKIRNLGPMINDGFPNCVHMPMALIKGLPVVHVLVAMRTLKVGEQVLWSYGANHPVKIDKYINFAIKESEQWFKEAGPIARYSEYIDTIKISQQETIESRIKLSYLQYLLTTPSEQMILILKKIISINELGLLTQQAYFERNQEVNKLKRVKLIIFLAKLLLDVFPEDQTREKLIKKVEFLFSQFSVSLVLKYLAAMTEDDFAKENLKIVVKEKSDAFMKNKVQEGLEFKGIYPDLSEYYY